MPDLMTHHFSVPARIRARIRQDHNLLIGAGFDAVKASVGYHAAKAFHVLGVCELDRDLNRPTEHAGRHLSESHACDDSPECTAKGEGYDVKILRKVLRIKRMDKAKRLEEEAVVDLYLSALGLI